MGTYLRPSLPGHIRQLELCSKSNENRMKLSFHLFLCMFYFSKSHSNNSGKPFPSFSSPHPLMPGMTHPRFSPQSPLTGLDCKTSKLGKFPLKPGATANIAHHIADPDMNHPGIARWSPCSGCVPLCSHSGGTGLQKAITVSHPGTSESMTPFTGLPMPARTPCIERYISRYPFM